MIYTVTFNPAIDYVVSTDELTLGAVNRAESENIYFGGKGINVSMVLHELDIPSVALGFVAGFTGIAIEQGVQRMGIRSDFVHLIDGFSRINVKLRSGQETELNGQGPRITPEALKKLITKLDRLESGDTLILAGSIPKSMPQNIYELIMAKLAPKQLRIVVDATGELLMNVLKYKPFLIKPNHRELGDLFGVTIESDEQIIEYARKLQEMGARNVLVSMAGDGAFLLDESGKTYRCGVCQGTVKNSVGAGDAMLAGFLAGAENGDYDAALKLGTAAGGATAFSDGLATRDRIYELLAQLG